jgi:GAF domain-containing protein
MDAGTDDQLDVLGRFAATVAEAAEPMEAFRAAEVAAKRLIGHRLFTVMAFHAETMEVERCYSSDPERYPPGGRKQKRDTVWGSHVLEDGGYFIGHDAADIRRHFDDHEVILGLGLGSVLNVPIKCLGRTIGTMNLLDRPGHYDEAQLELARIIAVGLIGPLQSRA